MIRNLTTLAFLSLPLVAQEGSDTPKPIKAEQPAANEAENVLFRAFWLDRNERRFAEAVELYKSFLEKAPNHRYAGRAANYALQLLNRNGKPEEADAFKTKYAAILKTADIKGPEDAAPAERPGAGGPPAGNRGNRPNVDELRKQLEKAKADGNAEEAKKLEEQIKAIEERRAGRGAGGVGGGQGRGRGGMGAMQKPVAEMNDEEIGQLQTFADRMSGMMAERMRQNGQGEQADKLEAEAKKMVEALKAGKKEDAEKARQELMKLMPRRGGN